MINIKTQSFIDCLSQVKLLALDVDGILTDGGLYYTESGEELKKFNVKAGQGLVVLQKMGIRVAIISGSDSKATLHRAKKLNIKYVYISVEDKLSILKNLCQELNIGLSQVAYMGDDLTDESILSVVGYPITVPDAIQKVKSLTLYTTQKLGGKGAVREVCDLICKAHEKLGSSS